MTFFFYVYRNKLICDCGLLLSFLECITLMYHMILLKCKLSVYNKHYVDKDYLSGIKAEYVG